uniref:Techylectin-5B n=1 Tax=Bactrocera dorsalis TaxID=27457 RepID=A0A034V0Z3_BACDO
MPALKAKQQQKQQQQLQVQQQLYASYKPTLQHPQKQQTQQLLLAAKQQQPAAKNWFLKTKARTTTKTTAMHSNNSKTQRINADTNNKRDGGLVICCRNNKRSSLTIALLLLVCTLAVLSGDSYSVAAAGSNANSGAGAGIGGGGVGGGASVRTGAGNPRLPRTSASQLNSGSNGGLGLGGGGGAGAGVNGGSSSFKLAAKTLNNTRNGNLRTREQQLLNIFEVIISTLEGKLKRIDSLDKSVEHMVKRMEALDNRVADNLLKTDAVISKLRTLDNKITNDIHGSTHDSGNGSGRSARIANMANAELLDNRLLLLDQKVSDIDTKLEVLKTQIDNNFLQVDDINAEASEKKPISMNVVEITKAMNAEVMNHVSTELNELRDTTDNIDKKLQFHINIVSENVGRMLRMVGDIHEAVVDHQEQLNSLNATTTAMPIIKSSKIDALVKQIRPMVSVSEKMDEVWDVVVGTKSSVINDLLPKSDALLTQTQRQERAIGEIHHDLKAKTNQIINNLDMVEKRLKKQEDDVQLLAQRPVPAELLMDPTIDRLVEYDPNRYSVIDEYPEANMPTTPIGSSASSTAPPPTAAATTATLNAYTNAATTTPSPSVSAGSQPTVTAYTVTAAQMAANLAGNTGASTASVASSAATTTTTSAKPLSRKGGIIFPSVKNKPSVVNSTFSTDILALKDIKGFSCVDLLNAGMRHSGVFYLQIRGTTYWFLKVFCEQEVADGGWTVIQRRDDFGEPRENFNRDWADYKNGFGDPAKEFWLGNENIYMLTNNEDYALRVELEDFEGNKRYAQYSHFKIHSEADYYKLEIDGYEGNAGDSLNDPWYGSNNSPFSTYNRDNDRSSLNCASMLKGGWWWKSCGRGLNGLYLHDPQDLTARQGIVWFRWRGWDYTLKKATMMIRPRAPQPMGSTASTS